MSLTPAPPQTGGICDCVLDEQCCALQHVITRAVQASLRVCCTCAFCNFACSYGKAAAFGVLLFLRLDWLCNASCYSARHCINAESHPTNYQPNFTMWFLCPPEDLIGSKYVYWGPGTGVRRTAAVKVAACPLSGELSVNGRIQRVQAHSPPDKRAGASRRLCQACSL